MAKIFICYRREDSITVTGRIDDRIASRFGRHNVFKDVEIQAILIALIILIGLCAAALFATGALMSMDKPAYGALLTIHKVALLLAIIAGAAVIYLLGST